MDYFTEGEGFERFESFTAQLESKLSRGEDFETAAREIPYAVHLNDPQTLEVVHADEKYAEFSGLRTDEIRSMGRDYLENYVHPATVSELPKFLSPKYDDQNVRKIIVFIQYLFNRHTEAYSPVITFTKASKLPNGLVVCLSVSPEEFGSMSQQVQKLIRLDRFKLQNFELYRQLTDREIDVLKLLVNGYNNPQIAEKLFISRQTVATHRKHIKKKLRLNSIQDLMKFGFAFDLIEY